MNNIQIAKKIRVHMQFKHTLALTLTLINVRNVLIECDSLLKLHMHPLLAVSLRQSIIALVFIYSQFDVFFLFDLIDSASVHSNAPYKYCNWFRSKHQ